MRAVLLSLLAIACGLVLFVNPEEAFARRGKRDYRETLSEGLNRRTGKRELEYTVHGRRGLKVEGMDRFGIGELPLYGGRAPRPSVIQPDLDGRTGRGRRGRGVSYEEESSYRYSDSCSGGY